VRDAILLCVQKHEHVRSEKTRCLRTTNDPSSRSMASDRSMMNLRSL
jgi:hypothetical protein